MFGGIVHFDELLARCCTRAAAVDIEDAGRLVAVSIVRLDCWALAFAGMTGSM